MSTLLEMTEEQQFAWMRERVPSAGQITVVPDIDYTRVIVYGAPTEELQRLRALFGLMLMQWIRVEEGDNDHKP